MRLSVLSDVLDGAPDPLGRGGHFQFLDAQGREGIEDGDHDGGEGANRSGLAANDDDGID